MATHDLPYTQALEHGYKQVRSSHSINIPVAKKKKSPKAVLCNMASSNACSYKK